MTKLGLRKDLGLQKKTLAWCLTFKNMDQEIGEQFLPTQVVFIFNSSLFHSVFISVFIYSFTHTFLLFWEGIGVIDFVHYILTFIFFQGLMRCSKSCRLRWTNYLRPGIKRGNFTEHEEKMIIHLQALLGNRYNLETLTLPTYFFCFAFLSSINVLSL